MGLNTRMPARTIKKRLTTTRKPARSASKSRHVGVQKSGAEARVKADVKAALSALERMGTRRDRENLVRFGITTSKAFGVSVANIRVLARRLGRNHELAAALWDTGWYEARMLTSFVDEPARVTPAQMDRWCRDFDNWGICDTLCFHLFDKTPHAWAKVEQWSDNRHEFVSARPLRCWPVSPCTTSAPTMTRSRVAWRSSSAAPLTSGTSSRRASVGPCA